MIMLKLTRHDGTPLYVAHYMIECVTPLHELSGARTAHDLEKLIRRLQPEGR